jgi:deoxycytidylate deaminase
MNEDIDFSELYILGLTGPVGAGCTTLSKIFDDDENNIARNIDKSELFKFLTKKGKYLKIDKDNEEVLPDHEKIDEEIKKFFDRIEKIDSEISVIRTRRQEGRQKMMNSSRNIGEIQPDKFGFIRETDLLAAKRELFNLLKERLEVRETLKSLDEFENFIDFEKNRHHFRRISMSDLIIFNGLIRQEKTETSDQKSKVNRFVAVHNKQKISDKIQDILKDLKTISRSATDFAGLRCLITGFDSTSEQNDAIVKLLIRTLEVLRDIKQELKKEDDYRTMMQDFGDNIRRTGNPLNYADDVEPLETRKKRRIHQTLSKDAEDIINFLFRCRRHSFFVIDCFRNPYEALYFKDRYVNFYLVSVNAPQKVRKERLKERFSEENERRDQGKLIEKIEHHFYMQNVPKTVKHSDIAINNEEDFEGSNGNSDKGKLIAKLIRYLALIFDTGSTKPNDDEIMMNLAYTMSMKSNCLSRQVGAVIVGKEGYIVGAGWNDVGEGKISCGLREIKDLRIGWYKNRYGILGGNVDELIEHLVEGYKDGEIIEDEEISRFCFCFKDQYSESSLKNKMDKLVEKGHIKPDCEASIREKLDVKRLEYCEALHAEENAIIQSSKIGGVGLIGGKIYTTAAPCELCAKKIQQVGISEIVYTEPYPGISEQIFLHNAYDEIKVRQFEGVMPHSYFRLFKVREDQKEWQQMFSKGLVW